MTFVETLLNEVKTEQNNLKEIISHLKETEDIYIFGTGMAAQMIYNAMLGLGISIEAFIDNNVMRQQEKFYNKNVLAVEAVPQQATVIIAANVKYEIHKQLAENNITQYYYIDPVYIHTYDESDEDYVQRTILQNAEKVNTVYDELDDSESKKVFKNILKHRLIHDLKLVWDVYDENQYFHNEIVKQAKGVFVDCGAFQGDTLLSFLQQVENEEYRYIAFEADENNYKILQELCIERNLENVTAYNLGVWSKKDILYFQSNDVAGEVSGKVTGATQSDSSISIKADSIDNVLGDEKIDFIKMDIEGAEIEALNGAEKSIVRNKPVLAISIYHELEHLWEIPLLIKKINPKYKLYMGHHMWNMADTVCYAIKE